MRGPGLPPAGRFGAHDAHLCPRLCSFLGEGGPATRLPGQSPPYPRPRPGLRAPLPPAPTPSSWPWKEPRAQPRRNRPRMTAALPCAFPARAAARDPGVGRLRVPVPGPLLSVQSSRTLFRRSPEAMLASSLWTRSGVSEVTRGRWLQGGWTPAPWAPTGPGEWSTAGFLLLRREQASVACRQG